jgi:chitodextrinase
VTGTTTVSGSASDDVGVTSASLLVDGKVVASAAAATGAVGFTWDTSTVPDGTHTVALQATDAAANIGTSTSAQVTVRNAVTVADTSPPTAPTNLTATLSGGTVKLTWDGSSDNVAVTGYTVYRGGVAVAISTSTSYTDLTPPQGTSSSYTVKATDAAGNLSGVSNTVSVAVPADKTLPTAPTNLKAVAGTKQVALTWTAAKDNVGVAHYYLYRGNVKYKLLGNVTSFTDTGLTTNTKYSYKVYALDAAGNWSAASTNVTATAR